MEKFETGGKIASAADFVGGRGILQKLPGANPGATNLENGRAEPCFEHFVQEYYAYIHLILINMIPVRELGQSVNTELVRKLDTRRREHVDALTLSMN
jgi:hypothetical protein